MTFGLRRRPILLAQNEGDKVMHNDTPLGVMMHLKELDRQATPKLVPVRARRLDASPAAAALRATMITLLRCLGAVGFPRRVESEH
jgi:hypothetical protein